MALPFVQERAVNMGAGESQDLLDELPLTLNPVAHPHPKYFAVELGRLNDEILAAIRFWPGPIELVGKSERGGKPAREDVSVRRAPSIRCTTMSCTAAGRARSVS